MTEPQHVTPQPSPTSIKVDTVLTGEGNKLLAVTYHTVVGIIVIFFEPETAENFGGQLVEIARQAKSSLILPPSLGNGHLA